MKNRFLSNKPSCGVWRRLMLIAVMAAVFLLVPASVQASAVSDQDAADIIGQMKQQLSDAFENMDQEMAGEVFSFLKEQVKGGDLGSEEGLRSAIREGEDKFGVEISEADAKTLVDTMEKLESLGFSAEYIVEKAESLYQDYGADFVDHVDEVVTGAVKNAASNVVSSFFGNLKNSVKNFFGNLF